MSRAGGMHRGVQRQPLCTDGDLGTGDPDEVAGGFLGSGAQRTKQVHAHALGVKARREGFDRLMNPFVAPYEKDQFRMWNDGWMKEHIRETRETGRREERETREAEVMV